MNLIPTIEQGIVNFIRAKKISNLINKDESPQPVKRRRRVKNQLRIAKVKSYRRRKIKSLL